MKKEEQNTIESETSELSKDGNKEGKTFTQDDINRIISERLEREQERFNKRLKEEVKKAQEEAEKLAKMSEEERVKEVLEKQRLENEKRERILRVRENRLEGIEKLNEYKMPIEFVDFVISQDKDKMFKNIETLRDKWQEAISNEVANQLKGRPLKDVNDTSITSKKVEDSVTTF